MVDTIRPDGAGPIDQDGESVASVASVRHTRAEPHWSDSDDPFQHLTPAERFARAIERRDALVRRDRQKHLPARRQADHPEREP